MHKKNDINLKEGGNSQKIQTNNNIFASVVLLFFVGLLGALLKYKLYEFGILLPPLVIMIALWLLVIEQALLNPNRLNLILFFLLCIECFLVRNEIANNNSIDFEQYFYKFVLAIYDVFLVLAGTIFMKMFLDRQHFKKSKNEEKTANQYEHEKEQLIYIYEKQTENEYELRKIIYEKGSKLKK